VNNTYRLLFNITFNHKEFALFLDKYNRYTFLSVTNNVYQYPSLTEYITLHNLYNNISDIDNNIRKFNFTENVLAGIASILAVTLVGVISDKNFGYNIIQNENNLEITEVPPAPETIYIEKLSELTEYLGYSKIEFSKVLDVIEANPNLNSEEKEAARTFAFKTIQEHPNFDFRIFYENMKDLVINRPAIEEHQKEFDSNTNGNYSPEINAISWPKDTSIKVLYHEFGHVSEHIVLKKDNITIKRVVKSSGYLARFLGEAMNNKLISSFCETDSYYNEGEILGYLLTCVNFTVEDFNKEDINGLVNRLKASYPNVDISYITKYIDAMAISRLNFSQFKSLKENPDLFDELFEICKSKVNIHSSNVYKPFGDFARLIYRNFSYEKVMVYLDRYNVYLQKLGYSNVINSADFTTIFDKYKNTQGFIIFSNSSKLIPYTTYMSETLENGYSITYKTFDANGNIISNTSPHNCGWQIDSNIKPEYILTALFKDYEHLNTPKFWENLNSENKINSPHTYKEIPIYYKGKLITTSKLSSIYLKIGMTPENKIGFNVYVNNGFSLTTDNTFAVTSNSIFLNNFLPDFNWLEKLELDSYLTLEYLEEVLLSKNPKLFSNVILKNDNIYFVPDYQIKVYDKNNIYGLKIASIYDTLSYNDDKVNRMLVIGGNLIDLGPAKDKETASFLEVLEYFSMLDYDKTEYSFTIDEIVNLFIKYNEAKSIKITR